MRSTTTETAVEESAAAGARDDPQVCFFPHLFYLTNEYYIQVLRYLTATTATSPRWPPHTVAAAKSSTSTRQNGWG
jgi:hypothetical protein